MELDMRVRVRARDPEAFGELFDAFARSVYNHAFRLTANWSAAEDVVALTFLEAWRLWAKIAPCGDSLRPWLFGIATNVVRNTSRADRRHAAAVARLPPALEVPDFADELAERH
jgi:RNA polymerase sigma-70 factor (ECF subfamily)